MTKATIFSFTDSFVQTSGSIASDMDGEKVMFNVQKGKYYNLGEVGGVIWELLVEPKTIAELTDSLVADYDIGEEDCQVEITVFLKQLIDEGLIEVG